MLLGTQADRPTYCTRLVDVTADGQSVAPFTLEHEVRDVIGGEVVDTHPTCLSSTFRH